MLAELAPCPRNPPAPLGATRLRRPIAILYHAIWYHLSLQVAVCKLAVLKTSNMVLVVLIEVVTGPHG